MLIVELTQLRCERHAVSAKLAKGAVMMSFTTSPEVTILYLISMVAKTKAKRTAKKTVDKLNIVELTVRRIHASPKSPQVVAQPRCGGRQ